MVGSYRESSRSNLYLTPHGGVDGTEGKTKHGAPLSAHLDSLPPIIALVTYRQQLSAGRQSRGPLGRSL